MSAQPDVLAVPCAVEELQATATRTQTQPAIVVIEQITVDPDEGFYSLRSGTAFDFWRDPAEDVYEDE